MTNGRRGLTPSFPAVPDPLTDPAADPIAAAKRALRRDCRARRAAAHGQDAAAAAERVAATFLAAVPVPDGAVVAGYAPIRDELDVMPLLRRLAAAGRRCCLPVVTAPATPLVFRAWVPGTALEAGPFGVAAPPSGAAPLRPDLVLVPMLAFDRAGMRMGYGAGFYDRTLDALRAAGPVTAIGVAFAAQEVPRVPADAHDQPLDWVVTDREAFRPRPDHP